MSSFRVMPQTYKTIKSGDVSNLSAELHMAQVSVVHVLTFVMILLTNAAQLACIHYYRRPVLA